MMNTVLMGLIMKGILIYLDDIMVYGHNFDDHFQKFEAVLQRLQEHGLTLKPTKCKLFQQRVEYLGHWISVNGIEPIHSKVLAVQSWKVPTTLTQMRSFLGFTNYYRRFIRHYAIIAAPLHALTGGPRSKEKKSRSEKKEMEKFGPWTEEHQVAFDTLKARLTESPTMAHPNWNRPFILTTDASNIGIGAVLGQYDEDNEDEKGPPRPVYYLSRALSTAERKYTVTEQECLAIVWAIRKLRCYLHGREFKVVTDHIALK
jgi:hypothetical protein